MQNMVEIVNPYRPVLMLASKGGVIWTRRAYDCGLAWKMEPRRRLGFISQPKELIALSFTWAGEWHRSLLTERQSRAFCNRRKWWLKQAVGTAILSLPKKRSEFVLKALRLSASSLAVPIWRPLWRAWG